MLCIFGFGKVPGKVGADRVIDVFHKVLAVIGSGETLCEAAVNTPGRCVGVRVVLPVHH